MGFPTTNLRRSVDWDGDGRENLPADQWWAPLTNDPYYPDVGDSTDICPLLKLDEDLFCHQDSDTITVGEDSLSDHRGDDCDNCPEVYNPFQEDWNGDGIGDLCDDAAIRRNYSVQDVTVIQHPSTQNPLPLAIPPISGGGYLRVWASIASVSGGDDVVVWLESVGDSGAVSIPLSTSPTGAVSERRFFLPVGLDHSFQLRVEGPFGAEILVSRLDLIDSRVPYQVRPYLDDAAEEWWVPGLNAALVERSYLGLYDQGESSIATTWNGDARIEGYAAFVNENIDEPFNSQLVTCGAELRNLAMVDGVYRISFDYVTLFNQPVGGRHLIRVCDGDNNDYPFTQQDDSVRGVHRSFAIVTALPGHPGCDIRFCQQGAGRYVVDNVRVDLLLPLDQ